MSKQSTTQAAQAASPTVIPQRGRVLQRACACGQHASGGECAECRKKRQGSLQRAAVTSAPPRSAPPIVQTVLRAPGQPLAATTRATMEPRFKHDFSRVRVHTDPQAAQSARAVDALAYTVGSDVVFGAGQYALDTTAGRRLLAHELTHVVQQGRSAGPPTELRVSDPAESHEQEARVLAEHIVAGGAEAPPATTGAAGVLQRASAGAAPTSAGPGSSAAPATSARPGSSQLAVDVLAAEAPEDFLVRAAAGALGVDIRVSSMSDLINQLSRMTGGGPCVSRLSIFNHGNPSIQTVSGGNKVKSPTGARTERPLSGFSLSWLFDNANQSALNSLRHSFCCNAEMNWYGCSTAGVWAEGGTRTAAEIASNERRYTGTFGSFYHDVGEAAAHGATEFRYVGLANVQSWSNALCTPISAATDFTNWQSRGSGVTRTVIYGGRQTSVQPQADAACACDPATGRVAGAAPSAAQLGQRAGELREQALRPVYEQARSSIGRPQPARVESEAERTERGRFEQAQAAHYEELGRIIRESVLEHAGLTGQPTTSEEALRVVQLWGLNIDQIVGAMPTLSTSLSGMLRGRQEDTGLDQRQRDLEAALSPRGRETFMGALLTIRRERFWSEHLARNTIYIFPDLSGVNRYRGYTQSGTRQDEHGRTQTIYVIHISKDLLESGQTELVAANLVHELSHTLYDPSNVGRAMESFNRDLAGLIADHPRLAQLRASAPDAAAARETHVSRIRQMLYEVTGYAEEEIFVHLQQLSHQPVMTINSAAVSGTDFILSQVTLYLQRLRRIGMPAQVLNGILASIWRRTALLYDQRIAAAPAGSIERRRLEINKQLAQSLFEMALSTPRQAPRGRP